MFLGRNNLPEPFQKQLQGMDIFINASMLSVLYLCIIAMFELLNPELKMALI